MIQGLHAIGLWYTPDENVVRAADAALQAMSDAGAIVVDNVNIASALSDYLNQYSAETNACGTSWNRYGITGGLCCRELITAREF